ncbi:PHB depolymerase family esterase [Marinobacter salicampi]|uniref:extracellular catalytic domain type 1 short-chain-length polyhydroxyalkanoate depolymerase n=1 Tax=Marinobacter salicampi TaxID=435907 RepID=UPI001409780C|nr:PHB depolymerase family esterase [Marinobacter salicampi]
MSFSSIPTQGQFALITLALSALLMISSAPVTAGQTYSYTLPQQDYNQSRARNYKVYVPDNLTRPAPMVMALHGCKLTNDDVLNDWGLTAAADNYGFILVAPFITSYDGLRNENCWGFWFDHHRHEGAGEVEDLHQIAQAVEGNFSIDSNRRFITGLSSGGAMATVAAVAHNEYWAAAAPAAGLPYSEDAASVSLSGQCPGSATFHSVAQVASDMQNELDDTYPIPIMILQNKNDCTVIKTAADNTRDAHLMVFNDPAFDTPAEAKASATACAPFYQNNYSCQHTRYTEDGTLGGRSLVETVYLDGPLATPNTQDTNHGHYWVGGEEGNNGKWSVKTGPSYPDIIWDFFSRNSRDGAEPQGFPVITLIGDNPMTINIHTTFTDPGATAEDAEDGSLTVNANCSEVDTSATGSYSCTYLATDSDTNTTTKDRTVEVVDPNAPIETCEQATASPSGHISADRAYAGGSYTLRALTSGDEIDIGGSFDTWSSVTLHEGEPGLWYASEPAACSASGGGDNGDGDGDGDGDGGSGDFTCQNWNDTNLNHDISGRAYYALGYYTTGGDNTLGALSGTYTWVKETSEGFYEAGSCN